MATKLKVLFSEALCEHASKEFASILDFKAEKLEGPALTQALADFKPDVLVVQNTKVEQDAIQAHAGLELVLNVGEGTENIAKEVAASQGTLVAHLPDVVTARSKAEYTFGLIAGLNRRIYDNIAQLQDGKWNKNEFSKSTGIKNRNLGIYGCGHCAREVAKAAKAFELNVQLHSPCECFAQKALQEKLVDCVAPDLATLAKNNDFIVVVAPSCCPCMKKLDQSFFDNLKDKATLVNVFNSNACDEAALLNALNTRNMQYGSDFPSQNQEINKHPLAYITDQVATKTGAVRRKFWETAMDVLTQYSKTRQVSTDYLANTVKACDSINVVVTIKKIAYLGAMLNNLEAHNCKAVDIGINNLGEAVVVKLKLVKGMELDKVEREIKLFDYVLKANCV